CWIGHRGAAEVPGGVESWRARSDAARARPASRRRVGAPQDILYLRRNFSTRPAGSTIFCCAGESRGQAGRTSRGSWSDAMVERVTKVLPQLQVPVMS